MWMTILGWFFGNNPLETIFKTIDGAVNNETQRDSIKADLAKTYLTTQASVLAGRGWWFPLFFLAPAGLWFASVCIYSMLFCKACVLPQTWTIAALPSPLDSWMGAIVGSLFIGKAGEQIISRLK
jgi:hypothetical protein